MPLCPAEQVDVLTQCMDTNKEKMVVMSTDSAQLERNLKLKDEQIGKVKADCKDQMRDLRLQVKREKMHFRKMQEKFADRLITVQVLSGCRGWTDGWGVALVASFEALGSSQSSGGGLELRVVSHTSQRKSAKIRGWISMRALCRPRAQGGTFRGLFPADLRWCATTLSFGHVTDRVRRGPCPKESATLAELSPTAHLEWCRFCSHAAVSPRLAQAAA